ncbi:MAG: S41 family peptidase [Treponema sp.]|nr:S41 family peptidase [Treponema sp.]
MKCKVLFFVIVANILLLISCPAQLRVYAPYKDRLPVELRQIINENRNIAMPFQHPDIEKIMNTFMPASFGTEIDIRIAEILRQRRVMQETKPCSASHDVSEIDLLDVFFTHEKLAEEIHFLFDLLRYGYSGYWYFGGDDVFLPIRDAMFVQLSGMNDPLQISSFLNEIIVPPLLEVIFDNHFQIHNVDFWACDYVLYMNEEFILHKSKTENLLVAEIDGVIHRVLKATPLNVPAVNGVLPTLTPDGEFAWAFGLITADFHCSIEMSVLFENPETGKTHYRIINLPIITSPRQYVYPKLVTYEINGVTVLENRSLCRRNFNDDSLDELRHIFYQSGYALREKPILILDLRGNFGGILSPAREWIRGHTGQAPIDNLLFGDSVLSTLTAQELGGYSSEETLALLILREEIIVLEEELNFLRSVLNRTPKVEEFHNDRSRNLRKFLPERTATLFRNFFINLFSRKHSANMELPRQTPIPNENLVIVLIDKNVSSAAEWFVGYLRQLENVLIVGTNTSGTILTSGAVTTALPHSGMEIWLGRGLSLRPDLSQFEGVGFKPDLWVPPGESLERVLRFIERYGLAR